MSEFLSTLDLPALEAPTAPAKNVRPAKLPAEPEADVAAEEAICDPRHFAPRWWPAPAEE